MSADPVFFDKSGRRWQVVKLLLFFGAATLVALPCFLVLSIERVTKPAGTALLAQDDSLITGSSLRAVYRDPPAIRSWRTRSQAHARADLD
jgi:hypothetical protein